MDRLTQSVADARSTAKPVVGNEGGRSELLPCEANPMWPLRRLAELDIYLGHAWERFCTWPVSFDQPNEVLLSLGKAGQFEPAAVICNGAASCGRTSQPFVLATVASVLVALRP